MNTSTLSVITDLPTPFKQAGALWEFFSRESKAGAISGCICNHRQAVKEAERLKNSSVDAYADSMISGFDALKSWAAGKGTLSNHFSRQPPPKPSIPHIHTQLAKSSLRSDRRSVGRRHM